MDDVKIINTFDKLYDLLKPEFNNGSISVVGSVLNHITGLKLKKDNSGDVDILLNTREAELRLIEISHMLSNNVVVSYEPNSKFRSVTIRYNDNIIESFRFDPKRGKLIDVEYKSKTYTIYKQNMDDQLNEILNIFILIYSRVNSGLIVYKNEPTYQRYIKIRQNLKRLEKQLKNVGTHIKNVDFDHTKLPHYKSFAIVSDSYVANQDIFWDDDGNKTILILHK